MARYLIGDIHGCGTEFAQLLEKLHFNPQVDQLYLAGDLVGRGQEPAKVLELAKTNNAKFVLGNHDLHFLATYVQARQPTAEDCFTQLYALPQQQLKEYVKWLLNDGCLFINDKYFALCHASLPHNWTYEQANFLGNLTMNYLRDVFQRGQLKDVFTERFKDMLALSFADTREKRLIVESLLAFTIGRMVQLYQPDQASDLCPGLSSSREFIQQGLLAEPEYSMLVLHEQPLSLSAFVPDFEKFYGFIDFNLKGVPFIDIEQGKFPWYDLPGFINQVTQAGVNQPQFAQLLEQLTDNPNFIQAPRTKPVYFGHWSCLNGVELPLGYICSDTSCVYGDCLSAYLLPEKDNLSTTELKALAQPIAQVKRILAN